MTALVGNGDAIELAISCIEVECAQINPGATTHLLVHTELGALTTMPYGIEGVVDAVGQRLVAHIDGITTCLAEVGLVGSQTVARLAAGGFHHAGCSCLEWILEVLISPSVPGKACLTGLLPLAVRCHLDVVTLRAVVVDNDFLLLPVALTRGEHYGSRLFQHGNQIGYDDGLGKQVFGGSKQFRALPLPVAFLLVVVSSVTGP